MSEQRRTSRKNSFRAAYAGLDGTPKWQFCLVRDLSPSGAKLDAVGCAGLPQTFDLHISGRDKVYRAEIVWRGSNEVGVRFLAKRHESEQALTRAC